MLRVVKVRLYPDTQQKGKLAKAFGSCRWVWNHFLNLINETYKESGKGLSGYDVKKLLPGLKKQEETAWLSETYSMCLQQVCLNLGVAFNNFFEKRSMYPNFKSKFGKQSLQYPSNIKIDKDNSLLIVPKIGSIVSKIHRPVEGKIKTVTITKNCSNQYYASILFEDETTKPEQTLKGNAIGVDLGLTHFAVTSDGSKYDNPRWFKKHERNQKIKQQQLSRKEKGSNNRNKSRLLLAKVHNKITRCREDFQHKLSRRIVNENQVICVENLAIRNMVRTRKLSKAISQVGWGQFCTMLKYKAEQFGKVYLEVDRFFASSKTCNNCLHQVKSLPLDIRFWDCPGCGTHHDRDINAAKNIRDEGLRILTLGSRDKAYCQTVRRSSRGRKKSTTALVSG